MCLYICLFSICIFVCVILVYLPILCLYICLFSICIFVYFVLVYLPNCFGIFAYFVFVFLLLQFCIFVVGAGELAAISALEAFSCRALFALNASNRNPPHTAPRPPCYCILYFVFALNARNSNHPHTSPRPPCCCIFHRICVYFDVIFFIQHPGHHVTVFPPYLCSFQCNFFLPQSFRYNV